MIFAVLATGPSLTVEQVEAVRHLPVVAVSDSYRLAPWAMALAANDKAWWTNHPEAHQFAGRKFSTSEVRDVELIPRTGPIYTHTNSGLLGIEVARTLGATRVLLLGFDMMGSHFFGPHPKPMRNTTEQRFKVFRDQFRDYPLNGLDVVNCTAGSALTCYPMARLEDVI